jgi:polyisoprenoid-binding protein YceI
MSISTTDIPGYVAGTWTTDTVHSDVSFTVRHMMVSKVRGSFTRFEVEIITAEQPAESSVNATIELDSIDTHNSQRDDDLRSSNFLDIANYPQLTYRSTGLRAAGPQFFIDGELSLHGVTKSVPLALEFNGFTKDPYGGTRAGFSATATIERSDFGITTSMAMDGGGVVVGDLISITLEIEAVLKEN